MNPVILLSFASGLLAFWLVIVTALIAKQKQFFKELSRGATKKDLTSILKQLNTSIKLASNKLEDINSRVDHLESNSQLHFQKIGFIRFNPFSDTGGDQSFSLCLLDFNNNGIVITSLHSRHTTRLYAKLIQADHVVKADYSDEEWQAYQSAKNYHQGK